MKVKYKAVLFVIIIYLLIALMASCGYEMGEQTEEQVKIDEIVDVESAAVNSFEVLEFEKLVVENVKPTVIPETTETTETVKNNDSTNDILEPKGSIEVPMDSPVSEPLRKYVKEDKLEEPEKLKEDKTSNATNTAKEENNVSNSNLVSLGEFKLTAYCSCTQCCGKYALNRPVDENGNEIVYGALGERLVAGVSIAVDPNVIPYYSKVVINGNTYIAHDTGGAIIDNRIDVYFDNHEDALNFGARSAEVYIVV